MRKKRRRRKNKMKSIELPVIYARNYDEIRKAEETGIAMVIREEVSMTTFYLPDDFFARINPSSEEGRTTIYFSEGESYNIDCDYETIRSLFEKFLK
jgi:inner membrane protein involved in colicin E2 resistance